MSCVYDIILNFNSELFEFYEWKRDDVIYHIKRINLILVESNTYNEILDNTVIFNSDFLLSIFNKCEYYTNRKIDTIPYAFLLTDKYRIIAIMLDSSGKAIKYSSLLLDEEEEVLDLCYKLKEAKIDYNIIKKRVKNEFQTREEKNIIKCIKKDLALNFAQKNISKLKYLYYEYFNKHCDDINQIYQDFLKELSLGINEKHYDLYNLIKLSYSKKNV